jgi:hypothetical protein
MRGRRSPQASIVAFVDLEERVLPHHSLRTIKRFVDRAWPSCRRHSMPCIALAVDLGSARAAGGAPSLPSPSQRRVPKSAVLEIAYVGSDNHL